MLLYQKLIRAHLTKEHHKLIIISLRNKATEKKKRAIDSNSEPSDTNEQSGKDTRKRNCSQEAEHTAGVNWRKQVTAAHNGTK